MKRHSLGRWVLMLLSALFILAGFFWIRDEGAADHIVAALRQGAPVLSLAVPLIGVIGLVAVARPRPGSYWLALVLGVAQALLTLDTVFALDDIPGIYPHWVAVAALPAAFVYTALAASLAVKDAVPLSSPLSRVAYLGRWSHLRDLFRLAEQWGWQATGPELPSHAVRIAGQWAGRELNIESGTLYRLSLSSPANPYLTIAERSQRNLWRMTLAAGASGLTASERRRAAKGKTKNAKDRSATFYLWPPEGTPADEVDVAPLKAVLDSGSAFLKQGTMVNAAGESVWFGRWGSHTMSETAGDVEALIRWLDGIAGVMEKFYSDDAASSGE